jgi:hypothetical protein
VKAIAAVLLVVAAGYPAQHAGSGSEPTKAAGIFAGKPFVARSALVAYDVGKSCCPEKNVGNLDLYLLERAGVTCAKLEDAKSHRFFSYTVEADGKQLPVGKPVPSSFFQQASYNIVGLTTGFQIGIQITYSRIDTSPNALWHGSFLSPPDTFNGKHYSLKGTFAAHWCGTRT